MHFGHLLKQYSSQHYTLNNRSIFDGCSKSSARQYSVGDKGPKKPSESFLTGTSGTYVEHMYKIWQKDPEAVHSSWDAYFTNVMKDKTFQVPPTVTTATTENIHKALSSNLVKQALEVGVKKTESQTVPSSSLTLKVVAKSEVAPVTTEKLAKPGRGYTETTTIQDQDSNLVEQAREVGVEKPESESIPSAPQLQEVVTKTVGTAVIGETPENPGKEYPETPTTENIQDQAFNKVKQAMEVGVSNPESQNVPSSSLTSKVVAKSKVAPVTRQDPPKSGRGDPETITTEKIQDGTPVTGETPENTGKESPETTTTENIEDQASNLLEQTMKVGVKKPAHEVETKSVETPKSAATPAEPAGGKPKPTASDKSVISATKSSSGDGGVNNETIKHHLAVSALIRSYQARGHLVAQVDPLGILFTDRNTTISDRYGHPPDEITREHKMQLTDMEKIFMLPPSTYIGGDKNELPLHEIIKRLEMAYCRHIGVEYMYIHSLDKANWIRERIEPMDSMKMTKEQKVLLMKRLVRAHGFEAFLAKKYKSEKRFGLEGGEVLIPALKQLIDVSSVLGVEGVNIAMAHRGRLNVLANVCLKPLSDMLTQFIALEAADEGSGDVKYHLGTSSKQPNRISNKDVTVAVMANPSHLEVSSSICLGKTRCEQFMQGDIEGNKVMAIIVHGDAAVAGQGIVYETCAFSYLPEYTTHGTIHVVINNQVGFTTDPRFSRSSPYCSDVGRVVNAPIFHVNGDDPESVMHVCNIAAEWRAKFHEDVVIDLVTYRRNGHNELDEPMYTQPLMYQKIRQLPPLMKTYSEKLIKENVITQESMDKFIVRYDEVCEDAFAASQKNTSFNYSDWIDSPWKGFFKAADKFAAMPKTGIKKEELQYIGAKFSTEPPADFVIHNGIKRILKNRSKLVASEMADWSLGEAFAYGSLVKEGIHVRLSGQDVERGTFSHRHHILHHQTEDKKTFNMLANLYPKQAVYTVCNSALGEYGILGFEVGYAQVSPRNLVMWEGQFGDFSNTAQVVTDQFISCGQMKWGRQCGIVVQLPHAMEGMGPEHSSARLERFLQMCDDDVVQQPAYDLNFMLKQHQDANWFVANCSTPASLFHILRRQIYLPFRKPLILMAPKSLLRLPVARSPFAEFQEGTEFQRVIPDKGPASKEPDKVKKLVFCCGKTYYDIVTWIKAAGMEAQIAVTRTEQLSPFPYDLIAKEMLTYGQAKVYWAQEEHKNQGGWPYMKDRIVAAGNGARACEYIGRVVAAAPATGNKVQHLKEIDDYSAELIKLT